MQNLNLKQTKFILSSVEPSTFDSKVFKKSARKMRCKFSERIKSRHLFYADLKIVDNVVHNFTRKIFFAWHFSNFFFDFEVSVWFWATLLPKMIFFSWEKYWILSFYFLLYKSASLEHRIIMYWVCNVTNCNKTHFSLSPPKAERLYSNRSAFPAIRRMQYFSRLSYSIKDNALSVRSTAFLFCFQRYA